MPRSNLSRLTFKREQIFFFKLYLQLEWTANIILLQSNWGKKKKAVCIYIALLGNIDYPIPPVGSVVKNPPASAGVVGSIPGSGRSPGEGIGNPLQYSGLGNPVDRGAWQATVLGVAKELDMTSQLNNNNILDSYIDFSRNFLKQKTLSSGRPHMYKVTWLSKIRTVIPNQDCLNHLRN